MITIISTGSINIKYGLRKRGIFNPLPEFVSLKYLSKPQPQRVTQKSRYISEPIGSRRLLTRKSSKSSTVLSPKKVIPFQIL